MAREKGGKSGSFGEKSEEGGGCNQLNQTPFKHQLDETWVISIGFRDMDVIGSRDDYGYVEVAEFKTQLQGVKEHTWGKGDNRYDLSSSFLSFLFLFLVQVLLWGNGMEWIILENVRQRLFVCLYSFFK